MAELTLNKTKKRPRSPLSDQNCYRLMLLPGIIMLLIFAVVPMFGILIAFQNYVPAKGITGSEWVGLENFKTLLMLPDSFEVLRNTLVLAIAKMVLGTIVPVLFALMLNEVTQDKMKKFIQTSVYLPYFLSWVLLGSIFLSMLQLDGVVNYVIELFGGEPVMFMASNKWAPVIMVVTDVWKNFGYGTVVYMASITSIDPSLYEAAAIDGANRWKQTWHITLPGMRMIIVLMMVLSLGNVLNAGFDQVYNMYSPIVYETGDIIDTMVYRLGLENAKYGPAAAVSIFKSVVSMLFISVSYYVADRFFDYRLF